MMTQKVTIPFNLLEFVLPDKDNLTVDGRKLTPDECELLKTHPYILKTVGFCIYANYQQIAHLHSLTRSKHKRATRIWAPSQSNYNEMNAYLKTLTKEKVFVLEGRNLTSGVKPFGGSYFILTDIEPVYLNNGKYEVIDVGENGQDIERG